MESPISFIGKANNPMPQMSIKEIEAYVHEVAQDSNKVIITDHCDLRMEEREITWTEALRCLRRGSILEQPVYNPEHGTWEFRMAEAPPRDIVCLVAAVKLEPLGDEVIAITVYEV